MDGGALLSTVGLGIVAKVGKEAIEAKNLLNVGKEATILGDAAKEASHVVYQGIDKAGVVRYVGITERGVATRAAEHVASAGGGKENLVYRAMQGSENLTKEQARVMEQNLINQYGLGKNGGQLLNKIYSISPKYWDKYGKIP